MLTPGEGGAVTSTTNVEFQLAGVRVRVAGLRVMPPAAMASEHSVTVVLTVTGHRKVICGRVRGEGENRAALHGLTKPSGIDHDYMDNLDLYTVVYLLDSW